MFRQIIAILLLLPLIYACSPQEQTASPSTAQIQPSAESAPILDYPQTSVIAQTDNFFGTAVADPYRWLEDDVRVNPEVASWVEEENAVSLAYLASLEDRELIEARLTQLWNYEKFTLPTRRNDAYFYRSNSGLQNQFVLYVQNGMTGEPRQLIDPNTWSDDGATALSSYVPSPDGNHVLYSIQDGGTDWRLLRVLDVESGEVLEDEIEWVKFSDLAWHPDGSGFYYSRFPEPEAGAEFQSLNFNQALYFHRLGDTQDDDTLVYARPDNPEHMIFGSVVAKRFLVIGLAIGTDAAYEIAVKDLQVPDSEPELIITGFENDYIFIGAEERTLFAITNADAPRKRLVAIDLDNYAADNWQELVPETENVLSDASHVGGKLVVEYMQDVKTAVSLFNTDGSALSNVAFPGLGTASGFEGDFDNNETFYSFASYNEPGSIYRYDMATGTSEIFKAPDLTFSPDDFVVEQVFYPSKDGTMIPMFIAHRQDLIIGDGVPALLYGYGGFDIPLTPGFSNTFFAWMDMGGVMAVANLRGGGEYGKEWHDAGRLLNKQNVFDDFIAAGEYLIDQAYTSSSQLAINGGSNGGLLVGAVTNQRPELFAAAVPAVGVMDMLRFDKFTAGRYWVDDYGKPSENAEDFQNNFMYSPYHNIQSGVDYPAIMATTADTDDRVVPGHSFKYMAALQAADTGDAPKIIRIETRAGHGSGKPTEKQIEESADILTFIGFHTGLNLPEQYGE
ncbi:MAG: prolyl oligopeptidase family serine peptidase [Gammaproteobacteria bacterium]|nr:prolyl oligopeptidase family serine peptidase [Gammaproteobacteria bacterium]